MLGNLLLEALVAPAGPEVSVQSGGQCAHQPHRVHILAPPCACTHLRAHTCLTSAPTSEPTPPEVDTVSFQRKTSARQHFCAISELLSLNRSWHYGGPGQPGDSHRQGFSSSQTCAQGELTLY